MNFSELNKINEAKAKEIAQINFKQNHNDNNHQQEDKHIIYTTHGLSAYHIKVSLEDIDSLEVAPWVNEIGVLMDYDKDDPEQIS